MPSPTQPLSDTARKAVRDLLLIYFCNSEINGTVANIPKNVISHEDWLAGWIPISTLASFKRLQAITKDPLEIARAAVELAPAIFEASLDGSKLRRRIPFDGKYAAEIDAREAISRNIVQVHGFGASTATTEVRAYFERFGPVVHLAAVGPVDKGTFNVEFANVQDMVKVLAQSHVYEDMQIQVQGKSKIAREPSTPSGTTAAAISSLETHAGVTTYPHNRIVQFVLSDPQITKLVIKAAAEQFASVHSIDLERDADAGYIRFKKSVAKEVVNVIERQGGLQVNGERVELRSLEGEEERLYWSVSKYRAENIESPKPLDAQSRRVHSRQKRRAERAPYNGRNARRSKNKAPPPKVKVDELQALLQGL
ncbi:hypothetical protein SpCBS45565_g01618 [Spizellomyces sp. 'palustris']|nr:hypothetical protein SpCBS45565_g01618 [Spizellomyces sp. 'palustris']